MIVHCEKHQDGYFYCDALRAIGRGEDRELAEELMKWFPAERSVRLVPTPRKRPSGSTRESSPAGNALRPALINKVRYTEDSPSPSTGLTPLGNRLRLLVSQCEMGSERR